MFMQSKLPAFQFYPGDWNRSTDVKSCSIAARGLWFEMLVLMHDGDPYGHLSIAGEAITVETLASLVGISERICRELLEELERKRVFSRLKNGVIYSRRMVRDNQIRLSRVNAGRLGGYPKHKEKKSSKSVANGVAKPVANDIAKPVAKSRSSTSSSISTTNISLNREEGSSKIEANESNDQHAQTLRADDQFLYQAARANQKAGTTPTKGWVLTELDRFVAKLNATDQPPKSLNDFRTHFINWLSHQQPPQIKPSVNPLDSVL